MAGMGFTNVRRDDDGNATMTDPNGREVVWDHEKNEWWSQDTDAVGENPMAPAKSVKAAAELTNSVKEKDEEQKPSWKHYAMGGLGVAGGVGLANLLRFFLMSNSRR